MMKPIISRIDALSSKEPLDEEIMETTYQPLMKWQEILNEVFRTSVVER